MCAGTMLRYPSTRCTQLYGTQGNEPMVRSQLSPFLNLRVEQLNGFLIDFHILTEGNSCSLGSGHQMEPAPGLARGIKLFHNRLMVFKGMHFREIIVTHNFCQTRDQRGRVIAAIDILLGQVHRPRTSGTARTWPRLVTVDQSIGGCW